MFDKIFNDNYEPEKEIINSEEYIIVETERSILYRRRNQMKLTQQQVADKANITIRQYQRLESGERNMHSASLQVALSICDVLKLDPHRFINTLF